MLLEGGLSVHKCWDSRSTVGIAEQPALAKALCSCNRVVVYLATPLHETPEE